ncbi:hypothetical protein AB9P05_05435 [Roseivirga sp. BDSF3-8]|uniref:hypothetical protein n=1 Tax=Roseivirga sp. BDSF3-8 TaxID=3241598 RepID=UPI003531E056
MNSYIIPRETKVVYNYFSPSIWTGKIDGYSILDKNTDEWSMAEPLEVFIKENFGIEDMSTALYRYLHGNGYSQRIGPETTLLLLNTPEFKKAHNLIVRGKIKPSGTFAVDMTEVVFHIGRTPVKYTVNPKDETITYTLYEGDGFWDTDFINERYNDSPSSSPDGPGPNLERL